MFKLGSPFSTYNDELLQGFRGHNQAFEDEHIPSTNKMLDVFVTNEAASYSAGATCSTAEGLGVLQASLETIPDFRKEIYTNSMRQAQRG
jgi:hypothetical protein